MTQLLVTEADYLNGTARAYQTFRQIVSDVVLSPPFTLLADDHVGDIAATIASLDSALPVTAARLVAAGDDASAFEAVAMAVHLVAKRDSALFDTAAREGSAEEIYKLRRECDGQDINANQKTKTEDFRWWEAINGDRLWRRRELYRLRHLRAEQQARAKKKAADA